ncbi:two-component system regulatory protein YycI [Ornithinibacillus californiensis]|uniref:two-component system regulatory protein YycI n=1 Tax=Ornithinibacillus californiensis TaxID=161536 RepID=UPI00064DDDA0|nr:two-component system regulatory protein YycI [Ornithinibacillus californiensis]
MQWGQIKTLFILSFLLLDIYLLVLVIQKQEDLSLLESIANEQEQDFLKQEEIIIPEKLPESLPEEPLITTQQKIFSEEEIEDIKERDNQEIEVVNRNFIIALLEEAVAIPENATSEAIAQLVTSAVYLGNEYSFDHWDQDRNIIVFFQKKNERPVYYNQNGVIIAYLNANNEIVAYTQSYLGEVEASNEEKTLIKPLSAIRILYDSNLLFAKDEVTEVEIGYHTFLPLDSGRQVLVPTWKIRINDSHNRLVNAYEQKVIPVNDDFVNIVLYSSIDNVRAIKGKEEFKKKMLDTITSKLQ